MALVAVAGLTLTGLPAAAAPITTPVDLPTGSGFQDGGAGPMSPGTQ